MAEEEKKEKEVKSEKRDTKGGTEEDERGEGTT